MKKQEKIFFVQNLAEELKSAKAAILIDYAGLSVGMQQELKKRLKAVGARMLVVKNTLFKLAGAKAELPKDVLTDTVLSGQTALVLSEDDPITPLGILAKFAREFETPQLKVGIIENYFQGKEELVNLSKLPGKTALFAQAVGVMASPMYELLTSLDSKRQELIYILNAKAKGGDH
jgi:large subunit ribosomal protein L10